MTIIHLANSDFEFELEGNGTLSIEESWRRHPLCLQLQFLPLLYANPQDLIAVTHAPVAWGSDLQKPSFVNINDPMPKGSRCYSWGASKRVAEWAKAKDVEYLMPPVDVVRKINSKAFSFSHSPQLPDSLLIHNEIDLKCWLKHGKGKRVLKTCFGLSGRGHYLFEDQNEDAIMKYCEKEWQKGLPVIAEPWVDRVFDFSTQWEIGLDGAVELVGSTVFEADAKGRYRATRTGVESDIFGDYVDFLAEHKQWASKIVQDVAKKGFFGNIGVDAFVYRNSQNRLILHPVVEINGRKTMSWAALQYQKKHHPHRSIRLFFAPAKMGLMSLLPSEIQDVKGNITTFHHALTYSFL